MKTYRDVLGRSNVIVIEISRVGNGSRELERIMKCFLLAGKKGGNLEIDFFSMEVIENSHVRHRAKRLVHGAKRHAIEIIRAIGGNIDRNACNRLSAIILHCERISPVIIS